MDIVTKDDILRLASSFSRKAVSETIIPHGVEFESSAFRQPELYGIPIFVIGYAGRTVGYAGQYIAHKIVRVRVGSRLETRWKILVGFVRIFAQHRENKNVIIEVFANGTPSAGAGEYLSNRDNYVLIEDRKEIQEIECREDDIINLDGVMKHEDPVLLIDRTGTFRGMPSDIFSKYTELLSLYETLQRNIFEQEQIMTELRVELETTKAENRKLINLYNNAILRIQSTAGSLQHWKYEMLKMKELMNFLERRLDAVKEGKERIQAVMSDYYELTEMFNQMVSELSEKFEQFERMKEGLERALREAPEPKKEKKSKEGEEE